MRNTDDNKDRPGFGSSTPPFPIPEQIREKARQKARSIKPFDLDAMTHEEIQHLFDEIQVQKFEAELQNEAFLKEVGKYKDQAALLNTVTENMIDMVVLSDLEGNITFAGKAHETLGYEQGFLLGKNVMGFVHPEHLSHVREEFNKLLASGGPRTVEYQFRCNDGSYMWLETIGRIVTDNSSNPREIVFSARDITQRKKWENNLKRIEWMLDPGHGYLAKSGKDVKPEYGDLSALNTRRVLLDSVGRDVLKNIVEDFLRLLGTSAAVYESNGDYALGIFSSRWCRVMDTASWRLCKTKDGQAALACGKWLCHESCWGASKICMESGEPVDIACAGGIRLYAAPIYSGGKIVGTINMGYGDPPRDKAALQRLSGDYGVTATQLLDNAQSYEHRPYFIIEIAKQRLLAATQLIGEIVDRKQAESALKKSEEKHRHLFETMTHGVIYQDAEGAIVSANPAAERILGLAFDRMRDRTSMDSRWKMIKEDGSEVPGTEHPAMAALQTGQTTGPVTRGVFRPDRNDYIWLSITAIPMFQPGEAFPFQVYSTFEDVTSRKQMEEKLSHSYDLMRYIIEHANSAVAVHDKDLRYIYVSQRYLDRYKVKEADVIGRHHYDVFPDLPQKWRDAHQKALAGKVSRGERDSYPRQDGTLDWTRWECRPWYEADGSIGGIVVYTEVITEWVAAQEALRKSEQHLNFVLEMSKTGGWELDLADETAYRTLEHDRIFGYESMLSEWTYQMFLDHVFPEDRPEVERLFEEAKASSTGWDFECRICRSDGEIRWIRAAGRPLPEKTPGRRKMSGIVQDITERKKAEEEKDRLNAQLVQSRKMESVGQLAGGVAHDFNNMLSIINGYAEMSVEMLSPEDPLHSNLTEIYTAGKRSAGIVRQLLAFARQQTSSPVQLDLNHTISSMLKMLQRLIGENIELVWHPSGSLWQVKIDPSQVDQIMANLAVNARDAISDVGKLTIETKNISFDQEYCRTHAGFIPGQYVMLAVSDNGCGMDKETIDNIFEPFFTTKEVGKGTGLGLPTVYGIVKQNSGFINVYSEPGQGTTFTIYLPRNNPQESASESASKSTAQMLAGSEAILLVEDETAILQLVEGMLERLGYTVLTAENPGEALKLAEKHEATIQLLITEVIMPEMNGRDLSARLALCQPAVKTLYMSGYTADVIAHHGVLEQGVHFIQKPFSIQDLAIKVREAIEQK